MGNWEHARENFKCMEDYECRKRRRSGDWVVGCRQDTVTDDAADYWVRGRLGNSGSRVVYEKQGRSSSGHVCRICRKVFGSGRALGGHMRVHGSEGKQPAHGFFGFHHMPTMADVHASDSAKNTEEADMDTDCCSEQQEKSIMSGGWDEQEEEVAVGDGEGGELKHGKMLSIYALRRNPKRSIRVADQSDNGNFNMSLACSQCGKEFSSSRALFGHMRCHPQRNSKDDDSGSAGECHDDDAAIAATAPDLEQSSDEDDDDEEEKDGRMKMKMKQQLCNKPSSSSDQESDADRFKITGKIISPKPGLLRLSWPVAAKRCRRRSIKAIQAQYYDNDHDAGEDEQVQDQNKEDKESGGEGHKEDLQQQPLVEEDDTKEEEEEVDEDRDTAFFLVMLASSGSNNYHIHSNSSCNNNKASKELVEWQQMTEESVHDFKLQRTVRKESDESIVESETAAEDEEDHAWNNNHHHQQQKRRIVISRADSKKRRRTRNGKDSSTGGDDAEIVIAAAVGDGKYRCTTCNKHFHSHQALGGHRASHRKVKGCFAITDHEVFTEEENITEEPSLLRIEYNSSNNKSDNNCSNNSNNNSSNSNPPHNSCSQQHQQEQQQQEEETAEAAVVPPAVRKGKGNFSGGHVCTICQKIFASGQALGGHKRCHWNGEKSSANNATAMATTDAASAGHSSLSSQKGGGKLKQQQQQHGGTMHVQFLDLNMPPPLEEEDLESACGMLDVVPACADMVRQRVGILQAMSSTSFCNGNGGTATVTAAATVRCGICSGLFQSVELLRSHQLEQHALMLLPPPPAAAS